MENVHIFTDSLTTLPQDLIEQLNIGIALVYVVFSNAQVYRHTEDICTEGVLRLVMETGRLPGIAAPPAEDLIRIFKPSIATNHQVLFISMSAEISSSYKNAKAAAEHFPKGWVTVMDSTRLASGTALLILQAAKLAARKRNMNTLVLELQRYRVYLKEEWFLDKLQNANMAANIYGLPNRIISPLKLRQQLDIKIGNLNRMLKIDRLNNNPKIDRNLIVISQTLARDSAEYVKNQLNEQYGYQTVIFNTNINGLLSRSAPRSIGISYVVNDVRPNNIN